MHKLHIIILLIILSLGFVFFSENTFAISVDVVISKVQLGDENSAKNELIELFNNSDSTIDITGWCVNYQSSSLSEYKLVCLDSSDIGAHLFLPSQASLLLVSDNFLLSNEDFGYDFNFSPKLSGSAGYLILVDSEGTEIDKLSWSVSLDEEGFVFPATNGNLLSRKIIDGAYIDTDISSFDFEVSVAGLEYSYGSVFELYDVCLNIQGIQESLPFDFEFDDFGLCVEIPVDICLNIDGFQSNLPIGYGFDENDDCVIDVCLNIEDLQIIVPEGLIIVQGNICIIPAAKLLITEVLPNAIGYDLSNEYIEIYNPTDEIIYLEYYRVFIGLDDLTKYDFPEGAIIHPFDYAIFSDKDMGFKLVNTNGRVSLVTDYEIIHETDFYVDAKEGETWSLIDNIWQYSNQITLGSQNIASIIQDSGVVLSSVSILEECSEGYYRNPDTNRCRKIPSNTSTLVPCKDGQYRSEETNRCRNIITDIVKLVPCSEGEERNPETNRCRRVISESIAMLEPCKEGQERNPDTNRCRNVVLDSIPTAAYAPTQVIDSSNSNITYVAVGIIVFTSIGYGVWEWRQEIMKFFVKK